jgi:D-3-phosphoglycerate dehydrogenase / 2-oxoglutarate reductase
VDSPVAALDKVITTPHLGASTEEAQVSVAVDMARSIVDALTGKGYRNAANVPAMDEETLRSVGPYVSLAEKLASVQTQLVDDPIKSITVNYVGDVASLDVAAVTRALLKGFFDPILEENVNYVNSPIIAKERGIQVSEKRTPQIKDFASLISIECVTAKKKHFIMGTLFTNNDPRIVKVDKFYVEAIPDGYMLVVSNNDVPGVVGKIGTILGKDGVNIAGISFGRDKKEGKAISLLNIDSEISKATLRKLKSAKDVLDVKQVRV